MKNKILKSTILYLLGNVLSKLIIFFLLPLYTTYIPKEDMGFYDSAIAVVTFFSSVLFLDIGSGIMRFMMERKEPMDKNYPIYSGLAIFIISLLLYTLISLVLGFTTSFEYYIWIVLYGFLLCLHTLYGYIARGWGYNNLYAFSGVVNTVVQVISNLVFILVLKWDYKSLYISYCLGTLINVIILEFKCKLISNFSKKYFDKQLFKVLLRFSLPLCVNSIAFWFLNSANKVIVTMMIGEGQNGYLAIANKFTSILYLVSSCFQLAWQELAYSKDNNIQERSTGEFYSNAFNLYSKILLVGTLIIIPAIKIIFPFFVDSSYNASASLIPLALMGTIMSILSSFLGSIFGGIKKTGIIFLSTLAGALVNLAVIFSLINFIGVMAANIAFLAGFTVNVLFRTLVLKKIIHMKVKYWYYVLFIPVFLITVLIYDYCNVIINIIMFIISIGLGCFVLRKEIKDIVKKFKFFGEKNGRFKNNS